MILFGFCAVLIFAGVAEGRLGWTHEQCVQSFGEPVGEVETKLVKSEGKADVKEQTLFSAHKFDARRYYFY